MKKYIAIAGAGIMMLGTAGMAAAATIDLGGEVRLRYETREGVSFGSDVSDNVHGTTQRTRLNVNAKVSDEISGFIQLQNIRTWGGTGTISNDSNYDSTQSAAEAAAGHSGTDFHQAYLQVNKVFGSPLSVRLGRQTLDYGNARLVGNLEWNQVGRSFDAAKIMYKANDLAIDVWSAKLTESTNPRTVVGTNTSGTGNDEDVDFYGVWATYKGIKDNTIDLYALLVRDATSTGALNGIDYSTSTAKEGATTLWTLGARLNGAVNGLDYEAEIDWQQGKAVDGNDIDALAYAVNVGYTLAMDMSPRISVEYVHADGDDNTSDSDVETFNQLFPTGHKHLGYADLVGFQNVDAWRVGASIKPTKATFVSVDYWTFNLDEKNDQWFRASGNAVLSSAQFAAADKSDDDLGNELDVVAKYKYADNLSLEAGYSLFMPGDYIDNNAGAGKAWADDDDQTWVYGMVTLTF